jgi:phosphatidylinositol N-acetylglucosaminyltransferase subunit C
MTTSIGIKTVKSSILVFLALIAVTPVLKTLTEATSSDSIWALAAILFGLNVLLADYGGPAPGPHHLTSVMSMNAAISASVVLASRLKTNLSVFGLILFAVLLFALFPILRKCLKVRDPPQDFVLALSTLELMVAPALFPVGRE